MYNISIGQTPMYLYISIYIYICVFFLFFFLYVYTWMYTIKADHIFCIFFINEDLAIISLDNKTRPKNSSNHFCIYIYIYIYMPYLYPLVGS